MSTPNSHDISGFPPDWEIELKMVVDALFGYRKDAFSARENGVLDRLDRLERLVKYGIGIAGFCGTVAGSIGTLIIQHFWR